MGQAIPQIPKPQVLPLISFDTANGSRGPIHSDGRVRFGFSGRLEYLKGPLPLVEGFRIASTFIPAAELTSAGDGSQRQEIAQTLRSSGLDARCNFVGIYSTIQERYEFMRDIDVFVLPSLTEGTPNVIAEAMAQGKPIVATAVGGIPDMVSEEVGLLVPPNDPKALGAAMAQLATDAELRKSMGTAARRKYEELFTPAAVVPLLIDFYKHVIDAPEACGNGHARHPWLNQHGK
jgi:glycosyltransferase involved in cell wall biosynthesis